MSTITPERAFEMMSNTHHFFTISFYKRSNCEIRVMNCRTQVHAFENGNGLKYNPNEKNLLPVWEKRSDSKGAECYRMVNLNDLVTLTLDGVTYTIQK